MRLVGDLEGNGLLHTITKIWCAVFKDIDTGQVYKFGPDEINKIPGFLDNCTVMIGHNFLDYDEPVLKKILNYTFKPNTIVIDTYIISQMVEPDRRKHPATSTRKGAHSLENFGNIFGRKKPEQEQWDVWEPSMLHRCSEDVEINHLTFNMLNREADIFNAKSIWYKPYQYEAAFARCLVKQKLKGFLLNQEKVKEHIAYLTTQIEQIDNEVLPQLPKRTIIDEQKKDGEYGWNKQPFKGNGELNQRTASWCDSRGIVDRSIICGPFARVSFEPFDLGSADQIKTYLLSQGWVPEQWNYTVDPVTHEQRRSSPKMTKDDPFNGVESDIGKKVALRMIYRHRRSQLEGFLRIVRADGRVVADATGITPTCRLKHSGIVNIPNADSGALFAREMREPFTVPPGYVLVGCDAASCQLRNLCHHMGDPRYTEAVVNGDKDKGTDVHSLNMRETGIQHRSKAKNFIYGFLFGAGNTKIASILGQDEQAAKEVRARFLANFPQLKALLDRLAAQFKQYGYIIGLDGRHIFPRSDHECLCYQLQSDEAIIMKIATLYAHKWIEKEGLDAHMVCHTHDEFQWEVREDQAGRVAELLAESIKKAGEYLKLNVPMAGDAGIGHNWAETH